MKVYIGKCIIALAWTATICILLSQNTLPLWYDLPIDLSSVSYSWWVYEIKKDTKVIIIDDQSDFQLMHSWDYLLWEDSMLTLYKHTLRSVDRRTIYPLRSLFLSLLEKKIYYMVVRQDMNFTYVDLLFDSVLSDIASWAEYLDLWWNDASVVSLWCKPLLSLSTHDELIRASTFWITSTYGRDVESEESFFIERVIRLLLSSSWQIDQLRDNMIYWSSTNWNIWLQTHIEDLLEDTSIAYERLWEFRVSLNYEDISVDITVDSETDSATYRIIWIDLWLWEWISWKKIQTRDAWVCRWVIHWSLLARYQLAKRWVDSDAFYSWNAVVEGYRLRLELEK